MNNATPRSSHERPHGEGANFAAGFYHALRHALILLACAAISSARGTRAVDEPQRDS
ncbi:MAG: hypothetical protein WAK91_15935 [Candidatus Acidiferrales bacterium]